MSSHAQDPLVIKPYLESLLSGVDLDEAAAAAVMAAVVEGRLPAPSMAAFLTALRAKGETEHELAAFAAVLRAHARRVQAPEGTVDTCGTGGDSSGTFNISTAAALVAAGMGIPVAKHGNRSVSSASGSADVLKALGVNIDAPLLIVEKCLREAGIAFLFAPALHPGMKHAAPVRRELGIRTVFNLLGPLSNPAFAKRQVLGVYEPRLCALFARVLAKLGSTDALVVCGAGAGGTGHLDEISTFGPSLIARLRNGEVLEEEFIPASLGLATPGAAALAVDGPEKSAATIRAVLAGQAGPARDVVVLNAAAAAQVAGLASDWKSGMDLAAASIDSGKALRALERLATLSAA